MTKLRENKQLHCYVLDIYIYIGGLGRELGPPNREIVALRLCMVAVLVKSLRHEDVARGMCALYIYPAGVVSCIFCDFGFYANSRGFLSDFWRVLMRYQCVLMSLNGSSEIALKFY